MTERAERAAWFSTTVRLFSLIDDLSSDKQHLLLKQLLGDRVAVHLHKLVLEMSEEQQARLLEEMLDSSASETTVTTLMLDENQAFIRQMQRAPCRLHAVCVLDATTCDGIITDISTVGVFIKTARSVSVGKPIRISCRLPGLERPLILNGTILRSEPGGIAVRFDALTAEQENAILSFIADHSYRNPPLR
jgi:hypothetical protein